VAYAVTGRAGPRGYLQRLAVDPPAQGVGVGAALVVDGLRWLRRWGAKEVMVNTQEGNAAAVRLYERLGFRLQADGLAVLRRSLGEAS
jgi:ribosomal protein S18 acetylase RimI-like enzyme